ncbi:MAG: cytochrome c3 family protein [bacterium]|nr:MAG: cytochrome c3 family protein [bacterium]
MSRKLAVIFIAIAVATAFAATLAVAADPPAQIMIDKGKDTKSGVNFDHAKHSGTIDCFKCHHGAKAKEEIKSCFDCHGKDASAPTVKDAFHKLCRDCHKEQGQGPTKCKECHVE